MESKEGDGAKGERWEMAKNMWDSTAAFLE